MLQRLPLERKLRPAWLPPYVLGPGRPAGPVEIPAGLATLGARFDELPFGWNNEFSALEVHVPAFSRGRHRGDQRPVPGLRRGRGLPARRPVDRRGLGVAGHDAVEHPAVWELVDGAWVYRTLFDRLPLDQVADWPVYVSLAEARAFARWRGGRLPSEAEFHRAASGPAKGGRPEDGNVGFRHWAPTRRGRPVAEADIAVLRRAALRGPGRGAVELRLGGQAPAAPARDRRAPRPGSRRRASPPRRRAGAGRRACDRATRRPPLPHRRMVEPRPGRATPSPRRSTGRRAGSRRPRRRPGTGRWSPAVRVDARRRARGPRARRTRCPSRRAASSKRGAERGQPGRDLDRAGRAAAARARRPAARPAAPSARGAAAAACRAASPDASARARSPCEDAAVARHQVRVRARRHRVDGREHAPPARGRDRRATSSSAGQRSGTSGMVVAMRRDRPRRGRCRARTGRRRPALNGGRSSTPPQTWFQAKAGRWPR